MCSTRGRLIFPCQSTATLATKSPSCGSWLIWPRTPEHVLIEVPFPDPPGRCDPNEVDPVSPAFCPQYSVNNATSTKQAVDVSKGLLVVAKDEREDEEDAPELSRAYYNLLTTEKLRKEQSLGLRTVHGRRPTQSSQR